MNISVKLTLCAIVLALFIISTGCQEQQSGITDKRARLVGNQNLQLKKQLKEKLHEKDQEIQRQKDLVAKCQAAMEAQKQQHNKSAEGVILIMQSFVECQTKVKQLEAQIEELQSK